MGLYKCRVRVPGGEWTNWHDWSTTAASELRAKSAAGPTVRPAREARPLPMLEHTVGFNYDQVIVPPPRAGAAPKQVSQMSPAEMQELVDGYTEKYITRPVQEFQ